MPPLFPPGTVFPPIFSTRERDAHLQAVRDLWISGNIDSSEEFRDLYNRIAPVNQLELLTLHPAHRSISYYESIQSNVGCMKACLEQLLACRHELIQAQQFSKKGDDLLNEIGVRATKEFFCFIMLASSQVSLYRRYESSATQFSEELSRFVSENFKDSESAFIIAMRNVYAHTFSSKLSWLVSVSWKEKKTITADITFKTDDIELYGDLNSNERRILHSLDKIDPFEISNTYFEKCQQLYRLLHRFHHSKANAVIENYYSVKKARDDFGRIAWMGILLQNREKKPFDVYGSLWRFFPEDQVDAILARPDHSEEQADYAISLGDLENACTPEMRESIRKIFANAKPRWPIQRA